MVYYKTARLVVIYLLMFGGSCFANSFKQDRHCYPIRDGYPELGSSKISFNRYIIIVGKKTCKVDGCTALIQDNVSGNYVHKVNIGTNIREACSTDQVSHFTDKDGNIVVNKGLIFSFDNGNEGNNHLSIVMQSFYIRGKIVNSERYLDDSSEDTPGFNVKKKRLKTDNLTSIDIINYTRKAN